MSFDDQSKTEDRMSSAWGMHISKNGCEWDSNSCPFQLKTCYEIEVQQSFHEGQIRLRACFWLCTVQAWIQILLAAIFAHITRADKSLQHFVFCFQLWYGCFNP